MKKLFIAFVLTMLFSIVGMAQGQRGQRQEKMMDKGEMIKHRTERMVKTYGLDEAQAQKLLELNTAFADKLQRPRGPRPDRDAGSREQVDGMTGATAKPEGQRPSREEMEVRMKKMRENMEAYNAELQKIFTTEQYAKYQEDMKKSRPVGRRGGHAPHQHNN